ncbi:MAG: hypothetical protein HXX13_05965 [Bacteroidetes bacterium]|nr:hypothetical protein [Bacteroidota bacterium]
MRYSFLILTLFLLFNSVGFSQDIPVKQKNHGIGIVPQYAFMNGLRTDLDFRLKKGKPNWLVISPEIFLSPANPTVYNYDSMWGAGLELQHRYYLNPKNEIPKGFYLGYGPLFQYFSITAQRYYTERVFENGIEYYKVKLAHVTTGIYKAGVTMTAGYQLVTFRSSVYFDFYLGTGMRLSFDDRLPSGLTHEFNDWWASYGYSGTLLTAGVRIGMLY